MFDFAIIDHGSVVTFTPLTSDAKDWLDDNVSVDDWQRMSDGFAVDRRLAADLLQGIAAGGFTVEA